MSKFWWNPDNINKAKIEQIRKLDAQCFNVMQAHNILKQTESKKAEVFVPASCSVAVINIHKTATKNVPIQYDVWILCTIFLHQRKIRSLTFSTGIFRISVVITRELISKSCFRATDRNPKWTFHIPGQWSLPDFSNYSSLLMKRDLTIKRWVLKHVK